MPLKNKEEYNKYMKDYTQRKRDEKKLRDEPVSTDDFSSVNLEKENKPDFDFSSTTKAIETIKDLTGADGKEATEDDPILKTIEKYSKYIPLAMKLIEGFKAAAGDFQNRQPQEDNSPQPPAGWAAMSPMKRLGNKYKNPDWYAAGEAYQTYLTTGAINPAVNINNVDRSYDDGAERRRQAAERNRRQAAGEDQPNPQNLKDLGNKYPDAPLVEDQPTPTGETMPTNQQQNEEILLKLQQDNARYLQMGIDYMKKMDQAKFEKTINNIDGLIKKSKPFIPFIPVHVKAMIENTTRQEIEEIFLANCPEKHKWLVDNDKIVNLFDLLDNIKKQFQN